MTGLSPTERAAHYRDLADLHLELGQAAIFSEARASHLELAALWTRLAAQAEHEAAQPVRDQDGEICVPSV